MVFLWKPQRWTSNRRKIARIFWSDTAFPSSIIKLWQPNRTSELVLLSIRLLVQICLLSIPSYMLVASNNVSFTTRLSIPSTGRLSSLLLCKELSKPLFKCIRIILIRNGFNLLFCLSRGKFSIQRVILLWTVLTLWPSMLKENQRLAVSNSTSQDFTSMASHHSGRFIPSPTSKNNNSSLSSWEKLIQSHLMKHPKRQTYAKYLLKSSQNTRQDLRIMKAP